MARSTPPAAGPCAHVAGTTRLRARLDLAGWTIALACCLVLRVRTITYQNTLDAGEVKHKFENDAALLRPLLIGCLTDLTQLARQAHRSTPVRISHEFLGRAW